MKAGDNFNGLKLERRMDSGKKEYRQVFMCYPEKEGNCSKTKRCIIIYDRAHTPLSMCEGQDKLPMEYGFYIEHYRDSNSGLPKLIDHGYDSNYVWLVVKYIAFKNLLEYMNDDYTSVEYVPTYESFFDYMAVFFRINDMLCQADKPLCITPNNIFLHETKRNISCYFVGLDTMLSPSYPEFDFERYDVARYLPPEIMQGEYDIRSLSYSYTLSLLSVIDNNFPVSHPGLYKSVTTKSLARHANMLCKELHILKLPKQKQEYFQTLLNPNLYKRKILLDYEWEDLCKIDEDNIQTLNNIENMQKMLQTNNPYDNCFTRTEGGGLDDVGGMEEIKAQIQNIKCKLRHRDYARKLNLNLSNILVMGPPGVGKSFLAKQIAVELNLPYYLAHTSDIVRPYHGDSANAINQLFSAAEKCAPCLLILDEVDCAAQRRSTESPGALETCNELLAQVSECNEKGVLVIATTNSIENIDPAFLRSKRFDTKLYIGFPDNKEKEKILRRLLRDIKNNLKDSDYASLVRKMEHFVSADIALAVEQACDDSLTEHSNRVFKSFLESLSKRNKGKAEYLKYVQSEGCEISEQSFDTWCRISSNMKLLDAYLEYIPTQDIKAETISISYEMLEKSIKRVHPSSSSQLECEYERKYREYLPKKNVAYSQIGYKQI